jgi:hypothetical protein
MVLGAFGVVLGMNAYPEHNGEWWMSTNSDQRVGFVVGYIDCYVFVLKGPQTFLESWYEYQKRVDEYYHGHPSERGKPVSQALGVVASYPASRPAKKWAERHGFFDGEYWRQSVPSQRLGFVQGFLDCQNEHEASPARYSRPDSWYVSESSEWYGVKSEDPGEVNAKRSGKKIADVLYLFRDGAVR